MNYAVRGLETDTGRLIETSVPEESELCKLRMTTVYTLYKTILVEMEAKGLSQFILVPKQPDDSAAV